MWTGTRATAAGCDGWLAGCGDGERGWPLTQGGGVTSVGSDGLPEAC